MKLSFYMVAAVVAMGLGSVATGCGQIDGPAGDVGGFSVVVRAPGAGTKASSDNTAMPAEAAIVTLDVFVFGDDGTRAYHLSKQEMSESAGIFSGTLQDVPVGTYSVVAIANAPEGVSAMTTRTAVESAVVTLAACDPISGGRGFAMGGSASVTVSSGQTAACAVPVDRYCGRVRLKSVTNAIPASIGGNAPVLTVKAAYLENIFGSWCLGGVLDGANPSQWVNLAGRQSGRSVSDDAAHFIQTAVQNTGYAAQVFWEVPAVSREVASSVKLECNRYFYCMPATKTAADHYGPTTEAEAAAGILPRLVIVAEINGVTYYYPVTIAGVDRNTAYDVTVEIGGMGSADPNEPVPDGSLKAVITVGGWDAGATYSDPI